MISDTIKYVNCLFEITKPKYEKVNDVILKSALVYQYLYLNNFDILLFFGHFNFSKNSKQTAVINITRQRML